MTNTIAPTHDLAELIAAYEARSAASETAWHPTWCRQDLICEGYHVSGERTIPALNGDTAYVLTVLDQGDPRVEIVVTNGGDESNTLTITATAARQLSEALNEAAARHQTA